MKVKVNLKEKDNGSGTKTIRVTKQWYDGNSNDPWFSFLLLTFVLLTSSGVHRETKTEELTVIHRTGISSQERMLCDTHRSG